MKGPQGSQTLQLVLDKDTLNQSSMLTHVGITTSSSRKCYWNTDQCLTYSISLHPMQTSWTWWKISSLQKRLRQGKASFMPELKLRAQKKETSHWRGASYTCLFTQIHFTQKLPTWELEVWDGALMYAMWNDYSESYLTSSQSKF